MNREIRPMRFVRVAVLLDNNRRTNLFNQIKMTIRESSSCKEWHLHNGSYYVWCGLTVWNHLAAFRIVQGWWVGDRPISIFCFTGNFYNNLFHLAYWFRALLKHWFTLHFFLHRILMTCNVCNRISIVYFMFKVWQRICKVTQYK